MADTLFEGFASGAAVTAIVGAAAGLGGWLFKVWRTRREDVALDHDKVTQRYEGYVQTLEARNKDLVRQINEANARLDAGVREAQATLTHTLIENEALRGELRMAQAAVTQLRAGLAPLAVSDIQYTVIYADQDCNILEVTPLVTALFHYFARELIGRNVKAIIPKRYHAAHDAGIAKAIASGKLDHDGKSMPMYALTKEGEEIPINLALSGWLSKGRHNEMTWTFMATITSRHEDAYDPFAPHPLTKPPVPTPDAAPVVAAAPVAPLAIPGLNPRTEVTP
jgi:PAS domain S-box-containing protein